MQIISSSRLDTLSEEARLNPRLRKNLNLHSTDQAVAHRLFNALEPESYIPPHRHLDPNKGETFLLVRGRLGVFEFANDGTVISSILLQPGEAADIPAGRWHTACALATGTIFFEAKAGPYLPFAPDELAAWAPLPDTPEATLFCAGLRQKAAQE